MPQSDAERWQRVKEIFARAIDLPAEARADFVATACEGDVNIRQQVESLLEGHLHSDNFLESPPTVPADTPARALEGQRLGPYEFGRRIGAGGMGEVYMARDLRLNRTVAIKVLPARLAANRRAAERFELEARAVAALNHPNICTLHDVGTEDGIAFLVMEYLDGETLADRLTRGPLTPTQAIECAIQIASALERIHRAGLVHRDLKPGNIMLTKGAPGAASTVRVKVLDFGISRMPVALPPFADDATRPALDLTEDGTVLGTVRYMSPEQLDGKVADQRSDIFAFGAVLYEMAVGAPAFDGANHEAMAAAIREQEPAPSSRLTPPLARVIRACLTKDPDDRWQTARDLLRELQWIQEGQRDTAALPARRRWMAPAALAVAAVAMMAAGWQATRGTAPAPPLAARFELNTPSTTDPMSFALSADGRLLVFVATKDGVPKLWVRPIDQLNLQALDGTDGASFPFWSPDAQSIGFFAAGKLRRIDVRSGRLQELADAPNGRGGSWNREDTIVFAPSTAGPLLRVPAAGGAALPALPLSAGQNSHRWPQFLPDGHRFLYLSTQGQPDTAGVFLATLDGTAPTRILPDDGQAIFVPPDRLLIARQGSLVALAFDPDARAVAGDPMVVAQPVGFDTQLLRGAFTASDTGVLALRTAIAAQRQLVWVDRAGRELGKVGSADEDALAAPELSPDGRRIAVFRSVGGNGDVWTMPVEGGVPTRVTFTPDLDGFPIWSRDGQRLIYTALRSRYFLFERSMDSSERPLFRRSELKIATDISPDGQYLLYAAQVPATGVDLWAARLPIESDDAAQPIARQPFDEMAGQFAPNGEWIAFQSNATGRVEVYVRPFLAPGDSQQVSLGGGGQPRWSRDGKELFYVAADGQLTSISIAMDRSAHTIEASAPRALFRTHLATGANIPPAVASKPQYVVAPDGRFLMNVAVDGAPAPPLTIALNWRSGLE